MGSINWVKNTVDKFLVTTENIIKLYETEEKSPRLITTENKFRDIIPRSISAYSSNESDETIYAAFATSTAKSYFVNLSKQETVEFQDSRQPTSMDFKGTENKLIIGYEKNKDHCISLWDLNRTSPYIVSNLCSNDGVTSLSWDTDYKLFSVGLTSKNIKIYDSRHLDKSALSVSTKHILNGIRFSPNGYNILSFAENYFVIHDLRFLDKTMIQSTVRVVQSAQWSPNSNVIGVIQGDNFLYSYENLNEDSEPYLRTCCPIGKDSKSYIASFLYKPQVEEGCLILTSCQKIVEYVIPQKNVVQFDTKHCNRILTASKEIKLISTPLSVNKEDEDISQIMQKRALKDYGLIADIKENGDLSNDPHLKSVWILLARMYDKGCMLGLKSILGIKDNGGTMMPKSESDYMEWCDYPTFAPLKIYKSENRTKAISLCGWSNQENNYTTDNSSKNGYHSSCRAALIACFQLKLKLAVEILCKSTSESIDQSNVLRISAIVIENFNPDKHNTSNLVAEIQEPFLKAIFAFLNEDYEYILSDPELPIFDKMFFALQYLPDTALTEFINNQIKKCIEIGDLNGILLVGASSEGVSLLQSYVDLSDDIQSVALIASRFFTSEPSRIQYWIQTYRDILDGWDLFDQRAQLDIMMNSKTTLPKAIKILCNFCGKSISSGCQDENRVRVLVNKISACPNCRKTLTRCSLCMLHLGTCSSDFTDKHSKKTNAIFQAKPFSNWFSWCQTCRHGGHMKHLLTWFSQNSVCPVTDCNCFCSNIDKNLASKMLI